MHLSEFLAVIGYALVLVYGCCLSMDIALCPKQKGQRLKAAALCGALLLLQGVVWLRFGAEAVQRLYPLITHLPLCLAMVFFFGCELPVAAVSITTAYLCCQLPRYVRLLALFAGDTVGEIAYILSLAAFLFLLRRYFVRTAGRALASSKRFLLIFGALPVIFYCFDYVAAVYLHAVSGTIPALSELLPTALCVFYVLFLAAYYAESERRMHAELQHSLTETELRQAENEIGFLRQSEERSAILQHDMRHHLSTIGSLIAGGNYSGAEEYIQQVQGDVEAVTARRFSANEVVNLLLSAYADKAERQGLRFTAQMGLPRELPIAETDFCVMLSNGLENALAAAAETEDGYIALYAECRQRMLLLEIRNRCAEFVPMEDGLPVAEAAGHGYGCRSIRSIAERHRGHCVFTAEGGVFMLRIMLPLGENRAAAAQSEAKR